jgi:hypothetical protein
MHKVERCKGLNINIKIFVNGDRGDESVGAGIFSWLEMV